MFPKQPKHITDHLTACQPFSHSASLMRQSASGHIFKQGSSLWAHGLFAYAIIQCLFHQYLLDIVDQN